MKTTSFVLTFAVILGIGISTSFAGSWIKKTTFREGTDLSDSKITNEETPESSAEGLFAKRWADENNAGLCLAAWTQNRKNMSPSNRVVNDNFSSLSIIHGYQWSERNPPLSSW